VLFVGAGWYVDALRWAAKLRSAWLRFVVSVAAWLLFSCVLVTPMFWGMKILWWESTPLPAPGQPLPLSSVAALIVMFVAGAAPAIYRFIRCQTRRPIR